MLLTDLLWALIGVKWTSHDFGRTDFRQRLAEAFRSRHVTPAAAAFGVIRLTLTPLKLTAEKHQSPRRAEHRWRMTRKKDTATLTTTSSGGAFPTARAR